MFTQEQINRIIKKISEKSKIYEEKVFLKSIADNLKITSTTLCDVTRTLETNSLLGTKFVMGAGTARAGGEQAGYGKMFCNALDKCSDDFGGFEKLIKETDSPQIVYSEFLKICKQQSKKPNKKINEGLITDFLKCVQNIPSNNLFLWLKESIRDNGIESTYIKLLKIHGIGKKITSLILRDVVWLLDLGKISSEDQIYLQPIDTWLKQISFKLWIDLHNKVDEFVIAKRIVDKCSEIDISSISFNQGAWYFGSNEVKDKKLLEKCMNDLISECKY